MPGPSSPSPRPKTTEPNSSWRPSWRTVGVVFGIATVFGLLAAIQGNYLAARMGNEVSLWRSLKVWLPDYYLWAAFSPVVVALGRRWPLVRDRWIPNLSRHLLLGIGFALVELLLSAAIVAMLVAGLPPSNRAGFWDWYLEVIGVYGVWGLAIYLLILGAGQAYDLYQRLQEQEVAAAELETRLAQAQLHALKMQLHPHFLFNTLHSIGVLVRKESGDAALEMITGLGDLLRYSLDTMDRQEVSLREELEFLQQYLDIEQVRFGDRLHVDFDVDPRAYDAAVPNMLLQPLVENAVRHAVSPHAGPREVVVEAEREAGVLLIRVLDDGPGLPAGWSIEDDQGVGLRNVRERLEKLYGAAGRLVVSPRDTGGVEARVRLPFRRLDVAAADAPPPDRPESRRSAEVVG